MPGRVLQGVAGQLRYACCFQLRVGARRVAFPPDAGLGASQPVAIACAVRRRKREVVARPLQAQLLGNASPLLAHEAHELADAGALTRLAFRDAVERVGACPEAARGGKHLGLPALPPVHEPLVQRPLDIGRRAVQDVGYGRARFPVWVAQAEQYAQRHRQKHAHGNGHDELQVRETGWQNHRVREDDGHAGAEPRVAQARIVQRQKLDDEHESAHGNSTRKRVDLAYQAGRDGADEREGHDASGDSHVACKRASHDGDEREYRHQHGQRRHRPRAELPCQDIGRRTRDDEPGKHQRAAQMLLLFLRHPAPLFHAAKTRQRKCYPIGMYFVFTD